jgi:triosephosphate isomerase
MAKKLIIANWKMNPERPKGASLLFENFLKFLNFSRNFQVIVCAPYVYLDNLSNLAGKEIKLGAQDVSLFKNTGSHTGEVSALMLKNLKTKYCIVGHSERRAEGESNEDINQKVKELLKNSIIPILCVGEKERDSSHSYLDFIKDQLEGCLNGVSKKDISKIIIAYEPVWAIGKGATRVASGEEFQEISIFIRKILSDQFENKSVSKLRIIYGGSVTAKSIEEFLAQGADGFLVGRASLDLKKFNKIVDNVNLFK